jgi:hypothetical protein
MPRYYFDIKDDRLSTVDHDGEEFPGLEAARHNAIFTAASLAKDLFLSGGKEVTVFVRSEAGPLFDATIVLTMSARSDKSSAGNSER